jgi:ligand-binding sensor domain-containing protein/two-component sensor histidine kinase
MQKLTFLLCLIFLSRIALYPASSKFEQITIENGLSHNTVHSILQDKDGFIWLATEDGLNRYDGYNFKIFRNIRSDSTSLSDNFIWTIFEDREGQIWVGTNNGGLNKYNSRNESFARYTFNENDSKSLSNNSVRVIYEDIDGLLWIGTGGGGLNLFYKSSETFGHYQNEGTNKNSLSDDNVLDITEDNNGNLLIATDGGGLNIFDKSLGIFTNPISPNTVNTNSIWAVASDEDNNIWLGTNGGGLVKYSNGKFYNFPLTSEQNELAGKNIITDVKVLKQKIWVCTEGGLFLVDKKDNTVKSFNNIPFDEASLSTNFTRNIYVDKTGIVWIGTVGGGVNKLVREFKKIKHYSHNLSNPNSLSNNIIRSVYEDKSNMLWIGTLGGGLNLIDKKRENYTHFRYNSKDPKSISHDGVTAITEDKSGNIWIGTWGGGLNKISRNGKADYSFIRYMSIPGNDNSITSNIVQAIHEDKEGNLWIGTENGLEYFDTDKNEFIHFKHEPKNDFSLSDNRIQSNCIFEDTYGNLWIGTWNGLNKLLAKEKKLDSGNDGLKFIRYKSNSKNPNSLSDSRITAIYEDAFKRIWIGTHGGGLNKLVNNPESNLEMEETTFINFTEIEGLASDVIYGILGDENGNLWLSTNNGLSKFNPITETFRNYHEGDGFQSDQFFWGASAKGNDGQLYFGGINGLNSFKPEELEDNPHVPPIYITDFKVFNKPLKISSENSPLKESIMSTKLVELSYDVYVLSFEFVALDYVNPAYNKYAYMLVGYDKDWIPAGTRRFVTYTNLKNGEYEFKVKGSNNDGVWNEAGTSLQIIIATPFWKAWWFLSTLFIIVILFVAYFVVSQINQMLAVERLRTKIAADLHDNIGSGLTEISILSEVLSNRLQHEGKEVLKSLKMISNSSRQIIDKMSDIVWLVNPKRDSLYDLILRLEDNYSELLSQTAISFTSKNLRSLEKISLTMEHRQHLFLIFKEGINNSINHGKCSEITLNANVRGKTLNMILEDNGIGFDTNSSKFGNGLNNMKARANKIGGKLEIFSSADFGTRVQFQGSIK